MKMNITQRDQRVLMIAGVVILLIIIYLGVDSMLVRYNKLEQKIETKTEALKKISHLREQYMETHQQLMKVKTKLDQMQKGFSVLSFIEDLANKEDIRENIGSVKPKKIALNDDYDENMVEVQMDNVTLPKLITFIYKIEHSGHLLKVSRLRIKTRYDNRDMLYVTLQVTTYTKKT